MQCSKQHFLFDHVIGGGEQRLRNGQAERRGRLKVDD